MELIVVDQGLRQSQCRAKGLSGCPLPCQRHRRQDMDLNPGHGRSTLEKKTQILGDKIAGHHVVLNIFEEIAQNRGIAKCCKFASLLRN